MQRTNSGDRSDPLGAGSSHGGSSRPVGESDDYRSSSRGDSAAIVQALRESKDNPEAVKKQLHNLRNLGDDQAGALNELREIMTRYRLDPRVMSLAAGAVWSIAASSDDKKVETLQSGCADTVLDMLRNGALKMDPDAVQWALGCITTLCSLEQTTAYFSDKGAIETIVEMLDTYQSVPTNFEWAVRALHALLTPSSEEDPQTNYEKNIIAFNDANGMHILINAMKQHATESTTLLWALKILWRIQDRADEQVARSSIQKFIDFDLIHVLVKILKARSTSADVFEQVAELICELVTFSQTHSAFAHAADSIATSIRVMQEFPFDESVQVSCCQLLSILARGNRQCKREISEDTDVNALVDTLTQFPGNVLLQEAGAELLWCLSSSDSFNENFIPSINALFDSCLASHGDSSIIRAALCGFTANACSFASDPGQIRHGGDVMQIIRTQSEGPAFAQACDAFACICNKFPALANELATDDLCTKLNEGLFNPDAQTQSACCTALTAIASSSEEKRNLIFTSGCLDTASASLYTASSDELAESVLALLSALVSTKVKKALQIPNETIQAVVAAMHQFPSVNRAACVAIRNTMLMTVPGFASLNTNGLPEILCAIIDSPDTSQELLIDACGAMWAFAAKQPKQDASHLSSLFRCVLGLMAKNKGDDVPYNGQIQTIASGALSAIMLAVKENPIHIPENDIDLIISILDLVIENDVDNVELMENVMDVVLTLSYLHKEILIQFGVIVVVIDCMVEHEQNEKIQQKGCSILALLASTENLQVNLSIAETDGIDMLVSALAVFSENKDIQLDACRSLSHLSIDHESRMLISSQGGLILLVNAINNHKDDVDLLEAACSALLNLSSDAEEQVLAGSNVVETVINVMQYQVTAPKLQEKGLGVLQNVSMRSKDAKGAIADAGGIDAVCFAVKEFMGSPSVLERAFTTMWSLAVLEENQVKIADAGGIGLVVNGMMANIQYEKVQKQACGCICTLSSNSRNKSLIREEGGVDSIVYAMWSHFHSEGLLVEACRALSSLAVNVQTNEVMVATEGEINAIMSGMRRFTQSERLQEHACVALRNFLLSADNATLVKNQKDEVIQLVNNASSSFPDRCAERANQIITSLQ